MSSGAGTSTAASSDTSKRPQALYCNDAGGDIVLGPKNQVGKDWIWAFTYNEEAFPEALTGQMTCAKGIKDNFEFDCVAYNTGLPVDINTATGDRKDGELTVNIAVAGGREYKMKFKKDKCDFRESSQR